MSSCPSRFTLARFVADDVRAGVSLELGSHLDICGKCRVDYEEIKARAKEYNTNEQLHLGKLRMRLEFEEQKLRKRSAFTFLAGGIVAAAALFIAVFFASQPTVEPDIMFKGAMTVKVVAKRGERQDRKSVV